VAAGSKSFEKLRFYDVQLAESGGQGLWLGHRRVECESVDCGFAAVRFRINSARIDRCKPVRLHDTAVIFREFATESDRAVGEPAINSKRQHSPVVAQRQHSPVNSECQHSSIVAKCEHSPINSKR
jgi:hypothetical protein